MRSRPRDARYSHRPPRCLPRFIRICSPSASPSPSVCTRASSTSDGRRHSPAAALPCRNWCSASLPLLLRLRGRHHATGQLGQCSGTPPPVPPPLRAHHPIANQAEPIEAPSRRCRATGRRKPPRVDLVHHVIDHTRANRADRHTPPPVRSVDAHRLPPLRPKLTGALRRIGAAVPHFGRAGFHRAPGAIRFPPCRLISCPPLACPSPSIGSWPRRTVHVHAHRVWVVFPFRTRGKVSHSVLSAPACPPRDQPPSGYRLAPARPPLAVARSVRAEACSPSAPRSNACAWQRASNWDLCRLPAQRALHPGVQPEPLQGCQRAIHTHAAPRSPSHRAGPQQALRQTPPVDRAPQLASGVSRPPPRTRRAPVRRGPRHLCHRRPPPRAGR